MTDGDAGDPFFALSLDMLVHASFDGYFVRLNPAWERTLGWTTGELMSQPMIEFVHPDDRERTRAQNRIVRAGGQAIHFENRYRHKDGSYRWLFWNATADLERQMIYSIARDITERKEAEAERERLVQELQAALTEVKTLRTILPVCSYCRKIRNDEDYWLTVEVYLAAHTSHGICPTCLEDEIEPQLRVF